MQDASRWHCCTPGETGSVSSGCFSEAASSLLWEHSRKGDDLGVRAGSCVVINWAVNQPACPTFRRGFNYTRRGSYHFCAQPLSGLFY